MPVTVEHSGAVACLGCRHPLPLTEVTGPHGARCLRCQCLQRGRLFHAAFPPMAAPVPSPMASAGEACCFEHPTKRAAASCDSCGRFLCHLCQFTFGVRNLCPQCIAIARQNNSGPWINRRLNWDTVALATAILPTLGIWTTIAGGPLAIYLGIRALRQAPGPVLRGRSRAIVAITLGSLQVLVWALLLITVFGTALFRGGRLG